MMKTLDAKVIEDLDDQLSQCVQQIAVLNRKLSYAERQWRTHYEWRRLMENFIRDNIDSVMTNEAACSFMRKLLSRVPLTPRKKFGRR